MVSAPPKARRPGDLLKISVPALTVRGPEKTLFAPPLRVRVPPPVLVKLPVPAMPPEMIEEPVPALKVRMLAALMLISELNVRGPKLAAQTCVALTLMLL